MTAKAILSACIDSLYDVFSVYEQPRHMAGAMGDIDETHETEEILSTPLRKLTREHIDWYCTSAITTVGSVSDFKFYLPRILELLVVKASPALDVPSAFSKLSYAEWQNWPIGERKSLLAYFDALWESTLSVFPQATSAGDCLDGLGQVVKDLKPYLTRWGKLCNGGDTAVQHLIEFYVIDMGDPDDDEDYAFSAWLAKHPDQEGQILSWIFSTPIKAIIQKACLDSAPGLVNNHYDASLVLREYEHQYKEHNKKRLT